MRILICNDDGYFAPGIAALAEVARAFGEVFVVAPEQDRSGASNSLTLDRPLIVREAPSGFRYVNGTPTDCAHVAITGLLDDRPDLVLSGINNGPNMGDDTLYSGTVAAAMEGYLLGVPAFAFSLSSRGFDQIETAKHVVRGLLERYVRAPMGGPFLYNVNIPAVPVSELKPMAVTRLGKRHAASPAIEAKNPRGETVWWIGPAGTARDCGPGTDFFAVAQGAPSMTPLQVDLTDTSASQGLEAWLSD